MKGLCEAACGSASAHLCNHHELATAAQAGVDIPDGWYTGAFALHTADGVDYLIKDCQGFRSALATDMGHTWRADRPNADYCDGSFAVLCCD